MKTSLALLIALAAPALASAAPLATSAAVHTQPNSSSPAIALLKAGDEPVASPAAAAPTGWLAVELPGPFEVYVENKDLTKSLDVKPGTALRLAPKADAGVLHVSEKGDKTTVTGLRGKWTQLSLERKIVGYIRIPAEAAPVAAVVAPAAGPANAGQPVVSPDAGGAALPRHFAGKFISTRRPLAPRRPFDYALVNEAGVRYAYLDVTRFLATEPVEKFLDREVLLFGAPKPADDGKELVVTVETMQLK
ncbi:MAG: hypothetical protein JNL39_02910 [Opitutaceae bacterium]|nr:hypothetical protein [Opitutaceae bacterium]